MILKFITPSQGFIVQSALIFSSLLASLSGLLPHLESVTVTSYISAEGPIAKAGVLANIGPNGSKSNGAKAGIVRRILVPNLFFHCCDSHLDIRL